MEIFLLDYGGTVNKDVDYRINENWSGIYLNGFTLPSEDMERIKSSIKGIVMPMVEEIRLTVVEIIRYKPWNFGKYNKGSGQMGLYRLRDAIGTEYFAIIKDYIASERDWRIALQYITNTEQDMKLFLMENRGMGDFAEYLASLELEKNVKFNKEC